LNRASSATAPRFTVRPARPRMNGAGTPVVPPHHAAAAPAAAQRGAQEHQADRVRGDHGGRGDQGADHGVTR
jgi:hypothetical protein